MTHVSYAPTPTDSESFEQYTVRAHKSLLKTVADPDDRNIAVREGWRAAHGELPGESVAARTFGPDKFTRSTDHCVFIEHETIGRDGKPRNYDLPTLTKIVQQHNSEILDLSAFPAIAAHHTPDTPGGKEPETLGFSGPFRLGMVGRDNPRWAIFADEHQRNDARATLDRKPYRSVELWTLKDGKMRFHPIAAVGAEAPRLLMPAKYTTATFEGAEVEKYTVSTAAMAGGSNTYVPSDKYAQSGEITVSPQDIASIMAALQETPEFQFLRRQMEEDQDFADDDTTLGDELGMETEGAPPDLAGPDAQDEFGDDPTSPLPGGEQEPDPDQPEEKFTMATANPQVVSVEKFTAVQNDLNATVEKYTQLEKSHQSLIETHKATLDRVQAIERVGTDAVRKAKIAELAGKYTMAIDQAELEKECLYSQGSTMDDATFTQHVGTIEKYAAKFIESPMVPRGVMSERYTQGNSADVEKYEQKLAAAALDYHSEQLAAGRSPMWSECEAKAKERIKAA